MRRDKFRCYICKSVGEWRNKYLHIHHIDESGHFDNPNNEFVNLVTLCIWCHRALHDGKKPDIRFDVPPIPVFKDRLRPVH